MNDVADTLLPGSIEKPFPEIVAALATGRDPGIRTTPPRTLAATVVAVCGSDRLRGMAEALQQVGKRTAIRPILISEGNETKPRSFVADDAIAIPSLKPSFVNNAVAALRLSSLPTIVWLRGCSPEMLEDLANLADRVVMDDPDPRLIWNRAVRLFDVAAFSDIRWTRLTRWRALMAHFFDIPEEGAGVARFDRLTIKGGDAAAAALLANWLIDSLTRAGAGRVKVEHALGSHFLQEVRLSGAYEVALTLAGNGTCVKASSTGKGRRVNRIVSLGDQSDASLIAEELRIRVREPAFERAVQAYVTAAAGS